MLMKKQLIIYVSLALLSLAACVTDFTPEVKGVSGILVVDGTITDGESVFRLSRSVGITDDIRSADTITNAEVSVERSDGVFFKASQESKGAYRAINGALDPNLEYRLNISLDGKQYQSSFLRPTFTPEIDSLSFQGHGGEKPVTIHVSSHAGKDSPPYYCWSYKENWEIQSRWFANAREEPLGSKNIIWHNPYTSENTYHCWVKDSSKVLLVGTTEKLTENRLAEHKLFEIPVSDERLSVLYHVEVSQMQIRKEAYDYFKILQDEIERTGNLFSPVLTAGENGNIYNVSDPDELVIGYVEVATVSRGRMFIENEGDLYLPEVNPLDRCPVFSVREGAMAGLAWYSYPDTKTYHRCVDCRLKPGATKNRPAWWPNEHY